MSTTSSAGGMLDELDRLIAANRCEPSLANETRIVELRNTAFPELGEELGGELPEVGDIAPASGDVTVDDLVLHDLTPERLRAKLLHTGAALLPQRLSPHEVRALVDGIDDTFDAYDACAAQPPSSEPDDVDRGWFTPFNPPGGVRMKQHRNFNRAGGGIWASDSPRFHFALTETFRSLGLLDLIAGYFGERPAISVDKSTLRRVPHDARTGDWHQDGAFLGDGIRSINAWICLSDCGVDAPGLDLVPRRLDLAATGTDGANFDWAVAPDVVDEVRGDVPVLRPAFQAGDVLLFDHLFLHRTATAPSMTATRYAIETWFFAPSCYPDSQLPIVL